MDDTNIVVVSKKQAKKTFAILAYGLIIYGIALIGINYSQNFLTKLVHTFLETNIGVIKIEYVGLTIKIIGICLATFIPFPIIQNVLQIPIKDFMRRGKISAEHFLAFTTICISLNLFSTFIAIILETVFKMNASLLTPIGVYGGKQIVSNIMFAILFIIITPICEEYIFRGVCLRTLGRFGNRFALIAVNILFAAAHGNLLEAIPAFFFGVALTLLTLRYKNINLAIVIHVINNAFFYLIELIPPMFSWITGMLILLVYGYTIYIIIRKHESRIIIRKENQSNLLWKLFFTSIPMLIALVLFSTSSIIAQFF